MNQTLWIQLYDAGYGAPTLGPVPVYPPTNVSRLQEKTRPLSLHPSKAKSLLKSHGWTVVPDGVTTCTEAGNRRRTSAGPGSPRARR